MRFVLAMATVLAGISRAFSQAPEVKPQPATTVEESPIQQVLSVGQQHRIGAQLQFGYPTGLRLQYSFYQAGDHSFIAEVFGGARSAFWGKNLVFGAGGRTSLTIASDGDNDALLFAPGIGISWWQAEKSDYAYLSYYSGMEAPETSRYFLNIDANLSWLHDITPQLGW